ncbi:MAG: hypothetical protein ABI862_12515 [Ilumatobacteraceae bacterium]
MAFDFISTQVFSEVEAFALALPPTWTRLEPQSKSGDPRPGIEARVHDPLWLLGRQWQLGEFEGEDAGTPLTVRVVTTTAAVDRWAPGDADTTLRLDPHDLLEPLVEAESNDAAAEEIGPGLRARAEAGSALVAAIEDRELASFAGYRQAFLDHCPLDLDATHHPGGAMADLDPDWIRLSDLLGGRPLVDAEIACRELEAAAGALPLWLVAATAADGDVLATVLTDWASWYRAEVAPQGAHGDAWVGERLEFRFRIGIGQTVLAAPAHGGGEIGWHSFDAMPGTDLAMPADGNPAPDSERQIHALLASPLRYPGMPSDRLWEMEDSKVNLGLVEAEPWDLARLLVAEFGLTYGNDWLVVPVDAPFGTLIQIESVMYVTTFGERFRVKPTTEVSPDAHWRMYCVTSADGVAAEGLLIPPGAVAVQDGPPIEEVLFLRDEMANLAWAVERSVQGPSGAARDRSSEHDGLSRPSVTTIEKAELDYQLQTAVPARWIPYLPKTSGYRSVELVQGAIPGPDGIAPPPLGRLLNSPTSRTIKDAEIPREGVLVRRQPSSTRRADGTYARWTTRRVSVGRGEGASQLAFDSARARKPRPNS